MYGDYRDFEKEAIELKRIRDHIANAYINQTGIDKKTITDMMDAETWFYGEEIVNSGFAGSIIESNNTEPQNNLLSLAKNKFKDFKLNLKPKQDDIKMAANYIGSKPIKNNFEKEVSMNKTELLEKAKNFVENDELTLSEIATATNQADKILSKDHIDAVNILSSIKKITGDNPIEYINQLIDKEKKNEAAVRSARMTEEFGSCKFSNGAENKLRTYAEKVLSGKELTNESINELKNDSIAKMLAGEIADENSDANAIGYVEKKKNSAGEEKKTRTVKL